jgi:methyl-accepting chemotaxis protein
MKFLKNLRLSIQLYSLVAVSLLLAGMLIAYAMAQVKSTQGTLKYTIDNRMGSIQGLRAVRESYLLSYDVATAAAHGKVDAATAVGKIKASAEASTEAWDKYFLADMIPEEQALADQTTPLIDAANAGRDKLVARLEAGQLAGIDAWTVSEIKPKFDAASDNLRELMGLQLVASNRDEANAKANYEKAVRNSVGLLVLGALLAGGFAWLIIRGALRGLGADPAEARDVARRIAAGDLTFPLDASKGEDESLMGALRVMKSNLLQSRLDYEGQLSSISNEMAVIEFSPDGVVTTANENFLKVTGYKLEEIRGQHHRVFVTGAEQQTADYAQFWTRLGRGEAQTGTFQRRTKDGRDIWMQASYTPILGLDGKPFKVVKYATDVTARREQEALNAAFKGALRTLASSVMVADNDGKIIYLNDRATALMQDAEGDFRVALPQFSAQKVLGANFDQFHASPSHQRNMLSNLKGRHETQIRLGRRRIQLVSNPMHDDTGRRLGTALEWTDRTQEMATEVELQQIISAVTAGDLDGRIALSGKTGFFETLSKGINDLVDSVATVVDEVQSLVSAANDGDLTKRVQLEGRAGLLVKIGSGINQLTDNMAGLVSRVKSAAGEVSRGADEISQGNTNLSQRTEEQASSLEETASSMEQMTSTVKQNADNAGQANQLAVAARDQAEKGGAVVSKAVKAMTEINESSKRIADIIGVIDEIAFQTNLLALNAAVEAARAGEQGRGFAVVASEVRNLAGRSATAAKEIKALIQDSVKKVDEGSSLVTQSGATLEQIVSAVKKVTDIVAEIAAASHEQSSGIEQVNKAVMQLDELTQQNAALVEEASAASQAMAEQARGLNDALAKYSVDDSRRVETSRASPAHRSPADAGAPAPAASGSAAPPRGVERRKAARPWSNTKARPPAPAAKPAASPASGTHDDVWKEF